MQLCVSRAVRVLAVMVAGGGCLAGCAGAGERLPLCSGRPLPINVAAATAVAADPGRGQVAVAREGGRPDAR
jgi:hypothetical protein